VPISLLLALGSWRPGDQVAPVEDTLFPSKSGQPLQALGIIEPLRRHARWARIRKQVTLKGPRGPAAHSSIPGAWVDRYDADLHPSEGEGVAEEREQEEGGDGVLPCRDCRDGSGC
jgi:hypothetical protein